VTSGAEDNIAAMPRAPHLSGSHTSSSINMEISRSSHTTHFFFDWPFFSLRPNHSA